jgi:hypothetical protein
MSRSSSGRSIESLHNRSSESSHDLEILGVKDVEDDSSYSSTTRVSISETTCSEGSSSFISSYTSSRRSYSEFNPESMWSAVDNNDGPALAEAIIIAVERYFENRPTAATERLDEK